MLGQGITEVPCHYSAGFLFLAVVLLTAAPVSLADVEVLETSDGSLTLRYRSDDLTVEPTADGSVVRTSRGVLQTYGAGEPDLPVETYLIAIPFERTSG